MARPGLRPMNALPLLEARRGVLEKCVFCPKLCRSACPVSNAEPRETLTPWGKMTLSWMGAHGDVPADTSHAAPAWACTGCLACRDTCDHKNPVADVLLDARDAFTRAGVAPPAARRVLDGFARHDSETRAASQRASAGVASLKGGARDALLVGCAYLRGAPRETTDAIAACATLLDREVALVEGCCGLPLRLAGDREGFARHAASFAKTLEAHERVTVVDPGCARTLRHHYVEAGVTLRPTLELLVEQAARALGRMRPVPHEVGPVRWHDPCQLGRGLGVYEAPRAILGRVLGHPPEELAVHERRELGLCSGAGGLLPSTMPDVARAITDARLEAHARSGGGRVVTACASSLLALRKRAASTSAVAVDDLVSWIARALS